jgi:hypothetical protein
MEARVAATNWVFVGDVGGLQTYHVGDEGMLDANLLLFRRIVPGLVATVVSDDPEWTAAAYGVKAVPRVVQECSGAEPDALLEHLLANLPS